MKPKALAMIVLALAISQPLSAQPKRPVLSYQQKQALVLAYRAGGHYGIGMIFAAVVLQESQLCKIAALRQSWKEWVPPTK